MKERIIILFICFPLSMLARTGGDTSKVKEGLWRLGIEAEFNYSYRKLYFTESIEENASRYEYMQKLNQEELAFWGYSTSVIAQRKLQRKFSILTGLEFSKYSYRSVQFDTLRYNPLGFDPANGPSSWYLVHARYYWQGTYVNVPIAVRYIIEGRAWSFVTDVGVTLGLFNQREIVTNSIDGDHETDSFESGNTLFACGMNMGTGFGYRLGNFSTIVFQPHLTYAISSIPVVFPITKRTYSAGIKVTFMYSIK